MTCFAVNALDSRKNARHVFTQVIYNIKRQQSTPIIASWFKRERPGSKHSTLKIRKRLHKVGSSLAKKIENSQLLRLLFMLSPGKPFEKVGYNEASVLKIRHPRAESKEINGNVKREGGRERGRYESADFRIRMVEGGEGGRIILT